MLERNMVGIQKTTQGTLIRKTTVFLCTLIFFFLLGAVYTYAQTNGGNSDSVITVGIKKFIFGVAVTLGGFIAGIGGVLLDTAVTQVVLQMGDWFRFKGIGSVVTAIWTMIRDLFNILFIFSLVYIGLRTILDSDDSRTKKMLGMLIAAALLINFSLYIAKVIVDISNFTAVEIHEMATKNITGDGYGIERVFITGEKSISGAYMEVLNINTWFDKNQGQGPNVIAYSLFMMIFLMFLGFVLAYGALMLVARFIAIIFYLIFSPFMFLGWVLPQFQSYATKWWKGFLGYSFFAPVYILMLYIGLYALQQIQNGLKKEANFSNAFGDGGFDVGVFDVFLLFAIGTGFLIAATKVAGIVSQGGAAIGMNMADKFSRKFTTGMGRYSAAAGAGFAYRQTGGGIGKGLQNLSEAREKRTGKSSMLTRGLRAGGESMQSKKIAGATSYKEKIGAIKDGDTRAARATEVHGYSQTLALDDTGDNVAKKQQAFADMTDSQLIEIAKTTKGRKLIEDNAQMLSSSQMQAIGKSEDINDTDTGTIGKAHKTAMKDYIASNGGVSKASPDQLNSLGVNELSEPGNAVHLTEDKIDKLKLVDDHKKTLKKAREDALIEVAKGKNVGGVTIDSLVKGKKPEYLSKLPKDIFTKKDFVLKLPSSAIQSKDFGNLDHSVQSSIKTILTSNHAGLIANQQEYDRIGEILDWFENSPQGKSFGK